MEIKGNRWCVLDHITNLLNERWRCWYRIHEGASESCVTRKCTTNKWVRRRGPQRKRMIYDAQYCEADELPDTLGDAAFQLVIIQLPAIRHPGAHDERMSAKPRPAAETDIVWRTSTRGWRVARYSRGCCLPVCYYPSACDTAPGSTRRTNE